MFYGRKIELELLQSYYRKQTASLLVVCGRRRIGKSRLIEEVSSSHKRIVTSGLAPRKGQKAKDQLRNFAEQLEQQGMPLIVAESWNRLFHALSEHTKRGRWTIIIDEVSWMAQHSPDFLGELKNAWDLKFKKNPKLVLFICGSASSWIDKNILSSTGFVGRVSHTLSLGPLPLSDCKHFWGPSHKNISSMEKLKFLSITGGIPRYLEELDPSRSAEDNISKLCFTSGALLVHEFQHIFSNILLHESDKYKKLITLLLEESLTYAEIERRLGHQKSGRDIEYLEELKSSGFLTRDYTWSIKKGEDSKLSRFRLSDNYIRFYLKYIEPKLNNIQRRNVKFQFLDALKNWSTVFGLQFENLVLDNRSFIWNKLGIFTENIVAENPYFQNKTSKQNGVQIDYLIQTRHNGLYLCEIKFSKNPIGMAVKKEVEEKIRNLKYPKGYSVRPVLIHINGITEDLNSSCYFYRCIDFSDIFY